MDSTTTKTEYVRKFLLKTLPVDLKQHEAVEIVQVYDRVDPKKEARVKKCGDAYTRAQIAQDKRFTKKIEEIIDENEFEKLNGNLKIV